MRINALLRVIGTLLYGFVGYEIGIVIAGTAELNTATAPTIWGATAIGAVLGYVLAPWLVMAPARAARNALRQVEVADLIAATIGLAIGLMLAALLTYPLSRLPQPFGPVLPFAAVIIFGYLGAAVFLMRRDDFFNFFGLGKRLAASTAISAPAKRLLLDTSVIIDGRIADIAKTGFLLGTLTVPRFVLNELQYIADSADSLRRNRGRRGLEVLDKLQNAAEVHIEFVDEDPADATQVDDKLVSLALEQRAAIITNDFNLNRVAHLQGITILNINELANAVKSVLLPGEELPIKIIQEGKEAGQGVGYLEDGTMVVVENGRRFLNQEILVQVTKVLQTNAGRLIFAVPNYAS
jgi:uncharacterized protein YacL